MSLETLLILVLVVFVRCALWPPISVQINEQISARDGFLGMAAAIEGVLKSHFCRSPSCFTASRDCDCVI